MLGTTWNGVPTAAHLPVESRSSMRFTCGPSDAATTTGAFEAWSWRDPGASSRIP